MLYAGCPAAVLRRWLGEAAGRRCRLRAADTGMSWPINALRQGVRPRWRPACTTHQLHGWGLRLNRPPGGADANEPWTVSRTNTYRGAVLPKGANTGGGALEGCSHGSTGTGHNQRANSFGPNELPAIATSGDTMLAFWMGLPTVIVFRPPWRSADFLEGPGAAAQVNVPPASQSNLEL